MNKYLKNKNIIFSMLCVVMIIVLLLIPTGFEKQIYNNAEGVKAKVISTDESSVYETGLIKQGDQICTIEILSGNFKWEKVKGGNLLTGKLETDKIFKIGDKAFVLLEKSSDGKIIYADMIDHYRLNVEAILIGLFIIVLVFFFRNNRNSYYNIICFYISMYSKGIYTNAIKRISSNINRTDYRDCYIYYNIDIGRWIY